MHKMPRIAPSRQVPRARVPRTGPHFGRQVMPAVQSLRAWTATISGRSCDENLAIDHLWLHVFHPRHWVRGHSSSRQRECRWL